MRRRNFIRGLVRVAPIVLVPAEALDAVTRGRSMVGWQRGKTHDFQNWEIIPGYYIPVAHWQAEEIARMFGVPQNVTTRLGLPEFHS